MSVLYGHGSISFDIGVELRIHGRLLHLPKAGAVNKSVLRRIFMYYWHTFRHPQSYSHRIHIASIVIKALCRVSFRRQAPTIVEAFKYIIISRAQ